MGSPWEPVSAGRRGAFFMTLKLLPFSVLPCLRAHGTAWSSTVLSAALSGSMPAACVRCSLWSPEKARVLMTMRFPQVLTLLVGRLHLAPSRPCGPSRGATRGTGHPRNSSVVLMQNQPSKKTHLVFSTPSLSWICLEIRCVELWHVTLVLKC